MDDSKINIMSVDVEDYFQVAAFDHVISPDEWGGMAYRAGEVTRKLLDMFAQNNVKATFFTLGWIAKKDPELIRRIINEGHEMASHGDNHQKVDRLTPDAFLRDLHDSKAILEDIGGAPVIGYRAPSFSINPSNVWAFDVLREAGFIYSSSTYPIKHDHYGTEGWPDAPFILPNGLIEFPQSTISVKGRSVPVGGGGYFRLAPLWMSTAAISEFHRQHEGSPYIFYFHPWEMDPGQPKIPGGGWKSNFRHYINQSHMESKVTSLAKRYNWRSFAQSVDWNNINFPRMNLS